jgi:hypothetical protein
MWSRLIVLFLLNSFLVQSQSATLFWQKCYGGTASDYADMITTTPDGGFVQIGNVMSNDGNVSGNHGDSDAWIVKSDVNGTIQWQKCLGGSLGEYKPRLTLTLDGGYLVIFGTESIDGTLSVNYGGVDICAVKLDASGTIEWVHIYGGSGSETSSSVIQLSDGGYVVSGSTDSNNGDVSGNHGGIDAWVFKIDAVGQLVWEYCFGGVGNDVSRNIEQTNDSGFVLIGTTESTTGLFSSNHGGSDFWVFKLNSFGTMEWTECLGGLGADHGYSIKQTSDDGYILIGSTQSNDGNVSGNHSTNLSDYWVVRLDINGNLVWQKCFGGSLQDFGYDIQIESNNTFLIAGTSQSYNGDVVINHGDYDYWVARIDSLGGLMNQYTFGGSLPDDLKNMDKTADGNYVLYGNTYSNNFNVSGNHGQYDFWVVKFCFPTVTQINDTVSDSISINGTNYTSSGIYYDTINNVNGCDSILILNLTITHLGFEDNNIQNIRLYPNPSNEYIHIVLDNMDISTEYSLIDMDGKIISTGQIETKESIIPVSTLSKGMYMLKINNYFERISIF